MKAHQVINQLDAPGFETGISLCATHLKMSCSITSSQYKPMRVRKSANDTVPSWRDTRKQVFITTLLQKYFFSYNSYFQRSNLIGQETFPDIQYNSTGTGSNFYFLK